MPIEPTPQSTPKPPQKAVSPTDALPDALRLHNQKAAASCAVSAQECIAKLHGFIPPDAFPLQSDPDNQKKGFGDRAFLKSHGLDAKDEGYAVAVAVALLESETRAGRFPLVSLVGPDAQGQWGYHVCVCAQHEGELLLLDPAKPMLLTKGRAELHALLSHNSAINPERKEIHILTYTLGPRVSQETLS